MELSEYLNLVRRRWITILACPVIAVLLSVIVTSAQTPLYQATARLFVSTPTGTSLEAYQGSLFSQQRMSTYADLVSSRELAQRIALEVGGSPSPGALISKLKVEPLPKTTILQLSVTDANATRARNLATAYGKAIPGYVTDLETPSGRKTPPVKITLIDSPIVGSTPVYPRPLLNALVAALLGLLLGLVAATLRDLLDRTPRSLDEVNELTGSPVLGQIPISDSKTRRRPVVTDVHSYDPLTEAMRVLRTNLQFVGVGRTSKRLTVTSPVPGEGKTSTAINIAITHAIAGHRTLLIDADLRRPQVAETLNLEGAVGLTSVLVGSVEVDDALQVESASGLHVLPSGPIPPNPAELLQAQVTADLLDQLAERYDVIVIDSPPLLPVTDAAILAGLTDGAVMVTLSGKTTREQIKLATQRLTASGAVLAGVVVNGVPARRLGATYGYKYRYDPQDEGDGDRPAHKSRRGLLRGHDDVEEDDSSRMVSR